MFPDFLDQEVQATREDVSSVFEKPLQGFLQVQRFYCSSALQWLAGFLSKVVGCPGAWLAAGLGDYTEYVGRQGG